MATTRDETVDGNEIPKEVSCYVYKGVMDVSEERGARREDLMEDLPVSYGTLTSGSEWMDWESNRLLMRNVGRVFSDDEIFEIGTELYGRGTFVSRVFPYVVAYLRSTTEMFHWSMDSETGAQHSGITCTKTSVIDVSEGHVIIDMRLKSGYRNSPPYNVMLGGVLASFPTFLSRPAAEIEIE